MAKKDETVPENIWEAMNELRRAIEDLDYKITNESEAISNEAYQKIKELTIDFEADYMEVENDLQGID